MAETARDARALLSDRSVASVVGTVFSSTAAALCLTTALGKLVFDLTGSELDLGLLGLVEFLPAFLLVIVTGNVADRFDRRRIVAIGLAGEAVTALVLAWHSVHDPSLGVILVLVFLFGAARAFVAPASRAMPANVVGPVDLSRLIAFDSVAFQAAMIVGPVLAGFLYVVSPAAPFIAAAAIGGIAAVVALTIELRYRAAVSESRPTVKDAVEGVAVIRRTPILLGAISLDLFAVLFGGAVALLPAIATDRLGVGSIGFGWLRAAGGIGAALMGIILAARPLRRHVGVALFVAVSIFGVATVVLGLTRNYAVAFLALVVLSGADAVSVFVRATLVPLVTPDSLRGRVMAVENVFIGASNELGAFESGVAGQLLGTAAAVTLGGIGTIVVAGVWATVFPALRKVDRFTDVQPIEDRTATTSAPRASPDLVHQEAVKADDNASAGA
jgi:MFS family permease